MFHLKEVVVVLISHLIIHFKMKNFMEIFNTVLVHLLVGFFLTQFANISFGNAGPVGIGGRLAN
jgi:hypothetical protein